MRLPSLFRRTPFRMTLVFLALFATAASALLAFIYLATVNQARGRAEADIRREVEVLQDVYRERGVNALNEALVERTLRGGPYLFLLMDSEGRPITGNVSESPIDVADEAQSWDEFRLTEPDATGRVVRKAALGVQMRLEGGELLFVGEDVDDLEAYVSRITQALWGAAALVVILGLAGGFVVSRNVERAMASLNRVVDEVRSGDLRARAALRGSGDELDELASGMNTMLDRLEASITSIRHSGDAVAHDLRSPLTRMRAKLEVALIDVENGKGDAQAALETALAEADGLLKTFNTVLAIARLQAAGAAPEPTRFDAGELAADMSELYEPAAEDKGVEFGAEIETGLTVEANREFLAQALANILDNAIKYTPQGGAVMLRARRRSTGEVEFSVTDTGPGVPDEDRERIVQRFVRLENSRNAPGAGLGLSLVSAVAEAHGGSLRLDEGPGKVGEFGPGLRVALVFPAAA